MRQRSPTSWHSFLDLRLLLVLAFLGLVASEWRPAGWIAPATAVKEVGRWLDPEARRPPQVALLKVDRPELALWGLSGPGDKQDQALAKALDELASQSKAIGIILPYPVDAFNLNSNELEALIDRDAAEAIGSLRRQIEQQSRTRKLLTEGRIILGISGGLMAGQAPLAMEEGSLSDVPAVLRSWLWPIHALDDASRFPRSSLDYFPVLNSQRAEQPLLFKNGDRVFPSFALALLSQSRTETNTSGTATMLAWHRDKGIISGSGAPVPVSAAGNIVPLITEYSSMEPSYAHLSLTAAIARPVGSSVVLVGSKDDPNLEQQAATLVALVENLVLVTPLWFSLLNKGLLLILLMFLILLVPRVSWVAGFFLCFSLAVALAGAQLWAQLQHNWWTPGTDALWSMAFGFLIMQVWRDKHSRILESRRRIRLMSIAHAQRLTELGELHQAQQTLIGYAPTEYAFNPYMTLAEAFASQGDYQQALKTIASVRPPKDKREELRAKKEKWERLASETETSSRNENLAATLIMELDGPMVLGRYEIQRELGRGAVGTVYLAYDPRIERKVAIKTLNFKNFDEPQLTDIKERFSREAAAAGRLTHPHIVSVFDVGEEQDLAFIAMDYVDGQPLSKYVTETHLLSPFEVYRTMAHVARALHYAHENNIIHRDIKPANIIYSAEPYQVKVTDFGIARLVDESRTRTGEILGSPLYIAPEQLQGKAITPSVDIFSLGVTFFQLISGHLPFKGDSLASLTYDIIYSKPESVRKIRPDLPASATRIINRALQKDVSRRFETGLEMAEAIEKAMRRDFTAEAKAAGYIV